MRPLEDLDPTRLHQIKLTYAKGSHQILIGCNCRKTIAIMDKQTVIQFWPIGPCPPGDTPEGVARRWAIYNDPTNHWEPFGEEDRRGIRRQDSRQGTTA